MSLRVEYGHKTVPVMDSDGKEVQIDEAIAPLLSEMWKAGMSTCNSCENVPCCGDKDCKNGLIYIVLDDLESFQIFTEVVSQDRRLVQNAFQTRRVYPDEEKKFSKSEHARITAHEGDWKYDIRLHHMVGETFEGTGLFVRLFIPRRDNKKITNLFQKFNGVPRKDRVKAELCECAKCKKRRNWRSPPDDLESGSDSEGSGQESDSSTEYPDSDSGEKIKHSDSEDV